MVDKLREMEEIQEEKTEMTRLKFSETKVLCYLYLEELQKGIRYLTYENPNPIRLQVLKGHLRLLLEDNKKYFKGVDWLTEEDENIKNLRARN